MKIITLKRLEATNFCGFAKVSHDFDNGVNSIVGATGTGKTTSTFELFKWLLGLPCTDIRPQTAEKKLIPKLVTNGKGTLFINGNEYILERVGKQKWRTDKETGIESYDGFEANTFIFDGVPCNATQYTAKLTELFGVTKEQLPLVVITTFFNTELDWKARRKWLFDLCGVNTITEELKKSAEYSLIAEDLSRRTTDEISKVLNTEKNRIGKDRQRIETTLNVYASDIAKYADYDFEEIEKRLNKIDKEIDKLQTAQRKENKNTIIAEKREEITKLEDRITQIKNDYSIKKSKWDIEFFESHKNAMDCNRDNQYIKSNLGNVDVKLETLKIELSKIETEIYDDNTSICPTCNRKLEQLEIENLILTFNARKSNRLNELKTEIKQLKEELKAKNNELKAGIAHYSELKTIHEQIVKNEPKADTEQIRALENDIEKLNNEISNMKVADVKAETMAKLEELKSEQSKLQGEMKYQEIIAEKNKQIADLNVEMQELNQAESINAKKRKCLNDYNFATISLVNDTINSHFHEDIKFRLFNQQTASAENEITEDCEVEYKGKSYSSIASNGQKGQADLLTCLGLQKILGITMPLFKDEAQSNTEHLKCKNQIIELITIEKDVENELLDLEKKLGSEVMNKKFPKLYKHLKSKKVDGVTIEVAYKDMIEKLKGEK